MNFLEELKRRNVYRVATAYVVVAWVLVQAADTLFPIFELPDQALRTSTVLLFLGFPLALILSWMFEFTDSGVQRTSTTDKETVALGGNDYVVTFLLLVLVGFMAVQQFVAEPAPAQITEVSAPTTPAPTISEDVTRATIDIGAVERRSVSRTYSDVALSSDGRTLFYTTWEEDTSLSKLYARQMDSLEVELLGEVFGETLISPTPSPNAERLIYETSSQKIIVDLASGNSRPFTMPGSGLSWGFDWASETSVVYAGGEGNELYRYSDDGASRELIQGLDLPLGGIIHAPQLLPGGEWIIMSISRIDVESNGGYVVLFNQATGESRTILEDAFAAKYVPSGHIVFLRLNDLWAVPFDLESVDTTGRAVRVISGIESNQNYGRASYDVSDNGRLVYMPGSNQRNLQMQLSWYDAVSERREIVALESGIYHHIRLSPDESEVALRVTDENGNRDIWIYSFPDQTFRRLTFVNDASYPIWSNSGEQIAYVTMNNNRSVWLRNADGSGQPQLLLEIDDSTRGVSYGFTADDSKISIGIDGQGLLLSTDGSESLESLELVDDGYRSSGGLISPDNNWIAYRSTLAGGGLFVSPYPNIAGGRWQVTDDTVWQFDWGREQNELYFRTDGVYSTLISDEDGFSATNTARLIERIPAGLNENPRFDINRAGNRFLFIEYAESNEGVGDQDDVELVVVNNWFSELNRLAPSN